MFTQGLVVDLIAAPELGPYELRLVDIDPTALEAAVGLSRRIVERFDAPISVRAATDRRELLPGAEVVVCTVGVGGRRAWERDVLIPRKYGVYQPVGDSVMPGGIARAMRMIPALVAIANDVAELCPDALLFNYSNPMTANCWAVRQATGVPIIGLCHGSAQVERKLARLLGAPPAEVSSLAVGLNHLTLFFDLRWRGRDAWPLLRERRAAALSAPDDGSTVGLTFPPELRFSNHPFAWSFFDTYGAYPSANDRHITEFFPAQFPGGSYYSKTLGVDAFSFEQIVAWGDRIYADMLAQASGAKEMEQATLSHAEGEHEQLVDMLRSMAYDERRSFYVNMPNNGAVPNLPADAILELPAIATASGLRPMQILNFPAPLAEIIASKLPAIRLTVAAALAGDRALMVEALLADGSVSNGDTARQLADELLEANRAYLPQFYADA